MVANNEIRRSRDVPPPRWHPADMTSCHATGCSADRVAFSDFCPNHGPADAPPPEKPPSAWAAFKQGLTAPPPAQQAAQQRRAQSAAIVCPHCQVAGRVTTKAVKQKKGVSGAKATSAVVTGGLSILATGLSRKESVTEASCGNCGVTWHIG